MSAYIGPTIDLIDCNLYVDPGNPRSYPGSGTALTNLVKNTHIPTLVNSPVFANNVFDFTGTNKHINLGTTGIGYATQPTIMAWVNLSSYATEQPIMCYGTGVGTNSRQLTVHSTGKANFNGFNSDTLGTTTLSLNTWYHLAGKYDGTNAYVYVNGVLENTLVKSWTLGVTAAYIGRDLDFVTAKYATTTKIGKVMYYDIPLPDTQILNIFNTQRVNYGV